MEEIKKNIETIITMTIINLFVLYNYIQNGKIVHGIGYFIFFYVAIFVIFLFTKRFPPKNEIEVKNPKKEFKIIMLFIFIGIGFITTNFYLKSLNQNLELPIKIPLLLGILFFTFPLGIAINLILNKYKIYQLGFKIKPAANLILGILICGLTGIFAYIFNKNGILWDKAYQEFGGVVGIILQGVIGAALVEEFMRFVVQTRFEKIYNINGFHILFATTIWAFMHFPVSYFQSKNVYETITYCIQIIPIGYVWGYLTDKTKSILPSTIVHGLNLWGIQNG